MIAYKIVQDNFQSVWKTWKYIPLTYKVGTVIKPRIKQSKLFVFKHLEDAKNEKSFTYRLLKVKVKSLAKLPKGLKHNRKLAKDCWKNGKLIANLKGNCMPEGTYLTPSLEVLEEIKC